MNGALGGNEHSEMGTTFLALARQGSFKLRCANVLNDSLLPIEFGTRGALQRMVRNQKIGPERHTKALPDPGGRGLYGDASTPPFVEMG